MLFEESGLAFHAEDFYFPLQYVLFLATKGYLQLDATKLAV